MTGKIIRSSSTIISVLPKVISPPGLYSIDFTTAAIEDPLSAGGVWSNNTMGVGGNVAPQNMLNMRVSLASDNKTRIAQHAFNAVVGYDDSFAFVPGISNGNIRVTAMMYRDPNYRPNDNHEVEIILGCASTKGGNHRWIECLWNSLGGVDIVSLDGQPSDFTSIGASTGMISNGPRDGDIWVAELNRSTQTVNWKVNGVVACTYSGSFISNLGSGAGIAAFRRPGDTNSAGMGFRSFKCEAF